MYSYMCVCTCVCAYIYTHTDVCVCIYMHCNSLVSVQTVHANEVSTQNLKNWSSPAAWFLNEHGDCFGSRLQKVTLAVS